MLGQLNWDRTAGGMVELIESFVMRFDGCPHIADSS